MAGLKGTRGLVAIIIALVFGGRLAYDGVMDLREHADASAIPVDTSLAELEAGALPEQSHLRIGAHYAAYWSAVFQYRSSSDDALPTDSDAVDYTFYPIFSPDHPYNAEIAAAVVDEDGNLLSDLTGFTVLVRTTRFATIGDVPGGTEIEEEVVGLVDSRRAPDAEELDLLGQDFLILDPSKLIVLEEGRHPPTPTEAGGRIAGGIGLIAAALGFAWWTWVRPRRRAEQAPEEAEIAAAANPAEAQASKPDPLFK